MSRPGRGQAARSSAINEELARRWDCPRADGDGMEPSTSRPTAETRQLTQSLRLSPGRPAGSSTGRRLRLLLTLVVEFALEVEQPPGEVATAS